MFTLTEEEIKRISDWSDEQDKIVAEKQGTDEAYYGAIGGELTYSFTPTSLGVILKVKNVLTGNVLDLTDYKSW